MAETKFKVLRAVDERTKSFGGLESRDLATILGNLNLTRFKTSYRLLARRTFD